MEQATPEIPGKLDLSKWSARVTGAALIGWIVTLIGFLLPGMREQVSFSYLVAFMFCLSFCLGGLFLVLVHHLVDASWSVPIRRINEHLACLAKPMMFMFIPIACVAPFYLYGWMSLEIPDHALHAKQGLLNIPVFYISSLACLVIWWQLSKRLRNLSLAQDKDGAAHWTHKMRKTSYVGIFLFAFSLTLAGILWMKGLQHQWFSTMYGVYYFAASVWTTLATVYMITLVSQRQGILSKDIVRGDQYYYLGTLLLAFTVFYSYIHFSQYFIIWNANIPEETFWYVLREQGTWFDVCLLIIFGHFFLPFLGLLRISAKMNFKWMLLVCAWAWFMHFIDMSFNILPVLHREGYSPSIFELSSVLAIGGVLIKVFIAAFNSNPPYPQKDPRMAECHGVYVPPASEASAAQEGAK